ncbi:MAG: YciI family protein [Pseudonocardiales bacterium]|nr:YciI family protein [Actinomycetota bacterium]
MAKYVALIYGDEQKWAQASPQWNQANGEAHRKFIAAAGAAVISANELEPTAKSITVRADSAGRQRTTDGPFLETKEVLGGYYVFEAADMAEAVTLASQIPEASAPFSGVEVRAIAT